MRELIETLKALVKVLEEIRDIQASWETEEPVDLSDTDKYIL